MLGIEKSYMWLGVWVWVWLLMLMFISLGFFLGGGVVEGCGVGRWLTRERSIGTLKNSIVFNILFFF